jgi:hypothetical protein
MDLDGQLHALRAKKITFRQFYLATRQDWQRMAAALLRHWRVPPSVTVDDVEQELLLAGWKFISKWDETRETSLAGYVVWNAHDKATKWLHVQRGVERHRRKGPSRFAFCISSLVSDEEGATRILSRMTTESSEDSFDYSQMLKMVPEAALTEIGRTALRRFIDAGGDAERAARLWYADPGQRFLFGLRSQDAAKKVIKNEVRSVRRRVMTNEGEGSHV